MAALAPASASGSAEALRRDARRVIAPMQQFERSTRALRAEVRSTFGAWAGPAKNCLETLNLDLSLAPGTEADLETRADIVTSVVMVDGMARTFAPVHTQLAAAAARWRALRLSTPEMRALAREQARGIDALVALHSVDTCAFYGAWRQTGLKTDVPKSVRNITDQFASYDRNHYRNMNVLRRVVRSSQADRFELFPAGMITTDDIFKPLPGLANQLASEMNSSAKANARNLVSAVEACYAKRRDYRRCDSSPELRAAVGRVRVNYGLGPDEVSVVRAAKRSYTVEAVSGHATRTAYQRFRVRRTSGGLKRTCTPRGEISCESGRW